jgi:hypothetical protein
MAINASLPKIDYERFARQGDLLLASGVVVIQIGRAHV